MSKAACRTAFNLYSKLAALQVNIKAEVSILFELVFSAKTTVRKMLV